MFWSSSKKETKKEKVTEFKAEKHIKISKSDGNIVNTSSVSSMTRQISASSSHSSEKIMFEANTQFTKSPGVPISTKINSQFRDVMVDAKPFMAQPPRSAFTSQPLTGRSALSPLDRSQQIRLSARIIPSFNNGATQKPSAREDEFRNKLLVKVTKSQRFYDDPSQSKVPVYRTRSKHKGQLLLINNIKFINDAERIGSELDEANLVVLFKEIGFQVIKYQNLNKKDMEANIKKFRGNSSLKKFDIAAVIIMSHGTGTERGDNTQVVCSDGQLLDTSWILNQFDSSLCKQLIGKPKIFVFQCCRGINKDMIQYDSLPKPVPRQQSDMLIAYSTIPGFVSHRDPNNGTWYIQAICKVFMEHAHDTDVESLLKIVDAKLSHLVAEGSKQTSSFENRGFKTCYLHPKLNE